MRSTSGLLPSRGRRSPFRTIGGSAIAPDGNGRPRASSSFLSAALSLRSRAISFSSTARSSGTAWQAQPTVRWLHTETSPLCVSRRKNPSATLLNVYRPPPLSGVGSSANAGAIKHKPAMTLAKTVLVIISPLPKRNRGDILAPLRPEYYPQGHFSGNHFALHNRASTAYQERAISLVVSRC